MSSNSSLRFGPRAWLAILLVLMCAAAIRVRLRETPLERDEGEYAYSGQLMLQGIPPYRLASNMKLPGTYAGYALLMALFGESIAGIHLGLLLVNGATIVLIALLGKRLFGTTAGLAACAVYALMSVGEGVLGTQAHATHFVVLAAIGGVLLLQRYADSHRAALLFVSGLLCGIAFVMKQQGVFFGLFGLFWLIATERRQRNLMRRLTIFAGAMALPIAITCLLLWHAGVFSRFWFWVFTYARAYVSELSISSGFELFISTFTPILRENAALWVIAGLGLARIWWEVAPVASSDASRHERERKAWFATVFLIFSFLAVCPGFYFRQHYFVLLLPAIALLAGAAIREPLTVGILAIALFISVLTQREFLFRMTPLEASRELYGSNPFPEAIPIADYIRAHSQRNARIAVIGSEPEIYFYADRHSATSYIYMYSLMEPQPYALAMQEDMIREVTAAAPEFVVEVGGNDSWLRRAASPTRIFDWWAGYRAQHYREVGIADITDDGTEYRWNAAAEAYQPQSDSYLAVYRRK